MIFYNTELDLLGFLDKTGTLIQISDDRMYIPLTFRWVQVGVL